jgi:DNA topoisomerase-1
MHRFIMKLILIVVLLTANHGQALDGCESLQLIQSQAERSPDEFAVEAGLKYVDWHRPGWTRRAVRKEWIYLDENGDRVTSSKAVKRLNDLAIPPAWADVWIAPSSNAHVLATGLDSKGRRQYLYHPRWREARDRYKFQKIAVVGAIMPDLRAELKSQMMKGSDLDRDTVLSAMITILADTGIRVGNERFADENSTFGLTTLQKKHVRIEGETATLVFDGKHGVAQEIKLIDKSVVRILALLKGAPGSQLFKFRDTGSKWSEVDSELMNRAIGEMTQGPFTAKDFRTWVGTRSALKKLIELGPAKESEQIEENISFAIDYASDVLGNTPSVAKDSYVAPVILDAYRAINIDKIYRKFLKRGLTRESALDHLAVELLSENLPEKG